ncbi:ThuA domain-containing protein [Actinoplanes sp. NPDC023714]|uniref:ThuA domain-containing protein n=1 Tax=Actinoplanes sp. NPDC023714 TaxID=3154322 RepID=UPI0033BFCD9F
MKLIGRFLVALVVTVGLAGPAAAQPAGTAASGHPRFSALVFSKTAAFRHDSIPAGVAAIQRLGARHHFAVDATEDAAAFTDANLARYDVVVWLSTTGDVLNDAQQAAFERYIRAGGGYAGIHAASDTEYDWAWYGGLVGAYFRDHPGSVNPQFQVATVKVLGHGTAATRPLPRRWEREEEWYNFRTNPRHTVRVLAEVDERTYDPRGYSVPGGSPGMGRHHPISWCQPYDGGRAFYTAMGHKTEYYSEPLLLAHLLGGIRMAAGVAGFPCGRED